MHEKEINNTFRIFSAFSIILVVAGDADFHVFDLSGLFPYYSFHVAAFLFISGYFYRAEQENNVILYLKKKFQRLMLPYLAWNFFYGIFSSALHRFGFSMGSRISLRTLFLEPFLGGHQFEYNFASWFVPALFLTETLNICMRKILGFLSLKKEWFITAFCLFTGMLTVWLSINGHVWGYYKLPGRILFMLPVYQLGQLYKQKIEKYDTLPNHIYFSVLFIVQLTIIMNCGGLAYSTVWCTGFVNGPVIPYLTIITGIAFWLRISKTLEPLYSRLKCIGCIGANTYTIMMHHILSFMFIKGILYEISVHTLYFQDFDKTAFFSVLEYLYLPEGIHAFKWVYLAAGIGIPLVIQHAVSKLLPGKKERLRSFR